MDKRSKNLKTVKDFDFGESVIQGLKLIKLIQDTVASKKLEKLTRRQLRSLVIRKWKEIKNRDNVELDKETERIVIETITDVFFATPREGIPEKIKKAIKKKVEENKKS